MHVDKDVLDILEHIGIVLQQAGQRLAMLENYVLWHICKNKGTPRTRKTNCGPNKNHPCNILELITQNDYLAELLKDLLS